MRLFFGANFALSVFFFKKKVDVVCSHEGGKSPGAFFVMHPVVYLSYTALSIPKGPQSFSVISLCDRCHARLTVPEGEEDGVTITGVEEGGCVFYLRLSRRAGRKATAHLTWRDKVVSRVWGRLTV